MSNTYHDSVILWKDLLLQGIREDGWPFDWTSAGIIKNKGNVRAKIVAKSEGIWATSGLVGALNLVAHEIADVQNKQKFQARSPLKDGQRFKRGVVVSKWEGSPRSILALERPFLNLASYVSGIATATDRLVAEVRRACPKNTPRVTATRKTLPGYRDLAIHGVQVGGGFSHRVNLAGGVLVKENHIAAARGIPQAIAAARATAPHGLKVEVEVRSEAELALALRSGAEAVLLDNFSPSQVKSALKLVERAGSGVTVEVSGGLNLDNIAAYAIPGVHILSVGSLTHSVKAVDLSLLLD